MRKAILLVGASLGVLVLWAWMAAPVLAQHHGGGGGHGGGVHGGGVQGGGVHSGGSSFRAGGMAPRSFSGSAMSAPGFSTRAPSAGFSPAPNTTAHNWSNHNWNSNWSNQNSNNSSWSHHGHDFDHHHNNWWLGWGWGFPSWGLGWGWGQPYYGSYWSYGYPGYYGYSYPSDYYYPIYSYPDYYSYGYSYPSGGDYGSYGYSDYPQANVPTNVGNTGSQSFASAITLFQQGNYQEAIRSAQQAANETPNDPRVQVVLSQAFFATGDFRQAAQYARQSLSVAPPTDWATLAWLYNNKVDTYSQQLDSLVKFIQQNPSLEDGRFLLGYQDLMMGHVDAAREQFTSIAARDVAASQVLRRLESGQATASRPAPTY